MFRAFLENDAAAERAVFHRYFSPLCLYAEKVTGQMAAAEDIVVESMEKAFRQRREFDALENMQRFLYRIVKNAALNYSNQIKTRSVIHEKIGYSAKQEQADEDVHETEILRVEILTEIFKEVENLPDQCRTIFKMIFLDHLSTEQIGEKLGLNPQTVRSQKSRAIQLLKTRLLKAGKLGALSYLLSWIGSN